MFARSGATSANEPYIFLKPGDAGRRERPDRPGADRVDADAVGPEVGGEVADRRLERGLGDAHHVVVRDDLLGAVVGQRQDATSPGWSSGRASRVSATSE